MKVGMIGLGKMGGNMATRIGAAGHEVVGYDTHSDASAVASLAELVERLDAPRVVWTMVPAGDPTEQVVTDLAGLLEAGDVVIDGGNANWHDSVRRGGELAERGILDKYGVQLIGADARAIAMARSGRFSGEMRPRKAT